MTINIEIESFKEFTEFPNETRGVKRTLDMRVNSKSQELLDSSDSLSPAKRPRIEVTTQTGTPEKYWVKPDIVREVTVMPPTPCKRKYKGGPNRSVLSSNTPLLAAESFGSELQASKIDDALNPIQILQSKISMPLRGHLYQLPSGDLIAAIRQPIQESPTCGPGCALMIGLMNMEKLIKSDDFWTWYAGTRLSNGESLLNAFKKLEIPARICRLTRGSANLSPDSDESVERKMIDPKDAVAHVKETISITRKPVILAITHPILKGHWIIVDGFANGSAYIRDPYTGKAFALPEEKLSKWLLEKDAVQEMVFFPSL